MSQKICPKCGTITEDGDFCIQCGNKLENQSSGFFSNLDEKITWSGLIFSFIFLGIFLFIGSIFWGIFTANGTIGFSTNVLLTVIFAVFFAGIVIGYVNCADDSYIVPNFLTFLGVIAAAVLCGVGFFFAVATALTSSLSSVFSSSPLTSAHSNASSVTAGGNTNVVSSVLSNFILDIVIIILLIPAASYLGIYLGYFIKNKL